MDNLCAHLELFVRVDLRALFLRLFALLDDSVDDGGALWQELQASFRVRLLLGLGEITLRRFPQVLFKLSDTDFH